MYNNNNKDHYLYTFCQVKHPLLIVGNTHINSEDETL